MECAYGSLGSRCWGIYDATRSLFAPFGTKERANAALMVLKSNEHAAQVYSWRVDIQEPPFRLAVLREKYVQAEEKRLREEPKTC
jgi:hypothetical protein